MSEVVYNFSGKNFIVTGASSGMGKQVTIELAMAGARVLAIARREEELKKIREQYSNVEYAVCDVQNTSLLSEKIDGFIGKNGKIKGTVFAAGISDITPIKGFDEDLARNIFEVNFWAAINFVRIVLKNKYSEKSNSHIIFSSVSGHSGEKGMFAYSGAKAALKVAVKSIAKEIANKQQRINTISPGWVKNDMTKKASELAELDSFFGKHLLGAGEVTDISGMILFLLSDRARWITGTDIIVDGGYLS